MDAPNHGQTPRGLNKKTYDPINDATGTFEAALNDSVEGQPVWMYPSDESVDIAFMLINGPVFTALNVDNQPLKISELVP
jgi:hypothetical protein